MKSTTTLKVGPLAIALSGGARAQIDERYRGYLSDGPADLRLKIEEFARTADSTDVYQQKVSLRGQEMVLRSPVLDGRIDFGRAEGHLALGQHPRFGSTFYLENALRQIAQILAIRQGSLLVHAAAVARPRSVVAEVFLGRSGAGKTTISALLRSAGGRVLSDDLVMLDGRNSQVSGTPFFGDLRDPAPAPAIAFPVQGIHILEQATRAVRSKVNETGVAVAQLIANLPFTECLDGPGRDRCLAIATRIAMASPLFYLAFPKDLTVLEAINWRQEVGHDVEHR